LLSKIEEDHLRRVCMDTSESDYLSSEHIFDGSGDVLQNVLAKWVEILINFRNFSYLYRTIKTGLDAHIDEVTYFQPYFRMYMQGILDDLKSPMKCNNANEVLLESTIRINVGDSDEETVVSLKGYSDLMIFGSGRSASANPKVRVHQLFGVEVAHRILVWLGIVCSEGPVAW